MAVYSLSRNIAKPIPITLAIQEGGLGAVAGLAAEVAAGAVAAAALEAADHQAAGNSNE